MTKEQKIEQLLSRGVEYVYPSRAALEGVLWSGKKIRLYNGIDPTGKLHIGHLAVLKKLRQFQDLGHEVIILIGDFTATIGDPTDKIAARKPLTRQQVLENAKDYQEQIGKILDLKKPNVKFLYNSGWINKLKPADLLGFASHFTVARFLERDMFQKRIREGKAIILHEFLYPLFQAYDSVAMDVDLEVGGNDQTFNMLRGRELMKEIKNKEKFVLSLKLLTDPSGKKMGKSESNFIALDDKPKEMFGKIMAWPDSLIEIGFELLTDVSKEEVKNFIKNPMDAKAKLAAKVVATCHNKKAAGDAEKEFNRIFRERQNPSEIPEVKLKEKSLNILDLLVAAKITSSKSAAKRLVGQGGVEIGGEIKKDWRERIPIKRGQVIRAGKRKFVKIF